MNHFPTEEWIDFSNQMVPAHGQLATEQHLQEGCNGWTQTVSRCQRSGPLSHIPEIRSARMGLLEKVVLSLKSSRRQRQKALLLLQLLVELAITLFIAGIVVPSLKASVAPNGALAGGSLHTINIIGVTFSYKYKNVGFAILGALVGATAAFAIASPPTTPKTKIKQPRDTR